MFCSKNTPLENHKRITILFAARLLKDKGLDILIEAVEQAKLQAIPVELIVAGIFDEESKNAYTV